MSARDRVPQLVAVTVAAGSIAVAVVGTPGLVERVARPCTEQPLCELFERPTPSTIELFDAIGVSVAGWAAAVAVITWVMLLGCIALGLLMVWRRPVAVAVVTALGLAQLFLGPFLASLGEAPEAISQAVGQLLLLLLLGLFPDGRWHPRWLRWAWPFVALVMAMPSAGNAVFGWPAPSSGPAAAIDVFGSLFLLAAQVHRYLYVSDWVARQQAKWVLVGFTLLAGNVLFSGVLDTLGVISDWQLVLVLVAYLALGAMAAGIGFAILRYRLYDVTVILRRAAVYAAALLVLTFGYVGLVGIASLSISRGSASLIGAAVLALLALGGGMLATRVGSALRRRFFGARSHRGGVAAALATGIAGAPANLAETISVLLGVPYAAVLVRDGTTLWTSGKPVEQPHRESVIDGSGAELGVLLLGPESGDRLDRRTRRALREVLPFVVLVLRAHGEAEELRLARAAAVTAREKERQRLRRDLHDGIGPLLAGQLLTLDTLRIAGQRGHTPEEFLAHLEEQARTAITEVRRISRDLRPAALEADGLDAALRAESHRLTAAGLPVRLHVDLAGAAPSPAVEVGVFRIVQEALANVVRHAGATAADVRVVVADAAVLVTVEDNGHGRSDTAVAGVGVSSMRHRATELGGDVEISDGADGAGTRVHARIPL